MIISDKQELRRCVKQLVRRADVCEASLAFDWEKGEIGLLPAQRAAEYTPFSQDAVAMFAALDAMDLPVKDLARAQAMIGEYDREAYLGELLGTMRAKCVLVRVPLAKADGVLLTDGRVKPLLVVPSDLFAPGRYGIDYASAAQKIAQAAALCGARNIALDRFDADALRYCLLPLCQDEGCALHVQLRTVEEIERFALLLDGFEGVRALARAQAGCGMQLIDAAAQRVRLLVNVGDTAHIGAALEKLGTRFVCYSAQADTPELMLGRWLMAKERIWQAMADAYLPLARTGYALESAAIERDVRRILSGNLMALCCAEEMG